MVLDKYIEDLLHNHDCVIIPGFGGFIGSYSSARIRKPHDQFFPPSKSILFNTKLHYNDGILANHISSAGDISYNEAMNLIHQETETWKGILDERKRLVIGRIGEMITDSDGLLQFRQNPFMNFLPDSYGLASFVSVPARLEEKVPEISPEIIQRNTPSYLKWAAILALPLGFAAWMSVDHFQRAKDFSASYSGIFISPPSRPDKSAKAQKTYVLPVPHRNPVTVVRDEATIQSDNKYAIIVGAFRFKENAENFVVSLRNNGFSASVYDVSRSGLTRVATGTYPNMEKALEGLASVRAEYPSAWILTK